MRKDYKDGEGMREGGREGAKEPRREGGREGGRGYNDSPAAIK